MTVEETAWREGGHRHVTRWLIFDDDADPFTYLMPSVELNGSPVITDVTAEQYLQYAARDLEEGSARGAMNALGNAKRALHLTVDSLLNAYGILARNMKISFPKKLELLDNAGLFSLSILNTLNLERNVMEHEYRVPSSERVQEVIDIGRLLLLATRRIGEFITYECLAGWRVDQKLGVVQLNPTPGLLSFFEVDGPSRVSRFSDGEVVLLDRIRDRAGSLLPGIEINPHPTWELFLEYKNRATWRPLLRPLIELNETLFSTSSAELREEGIKVEIRTTQSATLPRADRLSAAETQALDTLRNLGGTPILDFTRFVFGFEPNTTARPDVS
jgi:hypothetical protein